MNCPRCTGKLKQEIVKELSGNIEIDKCVACEGVWLDEGELRPFELVTEPVIWESIKTLKKREQYETLTCPKCRPNRIKMEKILHPRDSRIIIDECPDCKGIWLDKGEIEGIQKENILKVLHNLIFK